MADQPHPSELHILEMLVQHWPDAVLVRDMEANRYVVANPAAEQLLGYTRDELCAITPGDLSFPEDLPEHARIAEAVRRDGAVRTNWRARLKDGSPLVVEATITWSKIGGRVLGHGVFRPAPVPVSPSPPTSLSAAHAELIDRSGLIVIALDRQGLISFWNAAAEEHYGLSSDEAIGRSPTDLADGDHMREQVEAALSAGEHRDQWTTKFAIRRSDGSPFEAMVTGSVIRDDNGEYAGLLFVSAPVSADQRGAAPRMRRARVKCAACGREVSGTMRRKYCSEKCRQWAYYHRHLEAQRARSRERHERRRGDTDDAPSLVGAGIE